MSITFQEIFVVIREYPFLLPFMILFIPFAVTMLVTIWLGIILIRGRSINVEFRAFGAELKLSTIFEIQDGADGRS